MTIEHSANQTNCRCWSDLQCVGCLALPTNLANALICFIWTLMIIVSLTKYDNDLLEKTA